MKSNFSFLLLIGMLMMGITGCKKDENNDVRVKTYTPQDITQTTAKCGGDVFVSQGLSLSELGVCWSTNRNPRVEDQHLSSLNWSEPYACVLTGLEPGTTYHVRAYALRGLEYYYGDDKSFTTEGNNGGGGGDGSWGSHAYVDLGLPSGTLWAACNVGADNPEDYGDYFDWGETSPKNTYNWSTYNWCNVYDDRITQYCNDSGFGNNIFTDALTSLSPEDDAATANWGNGWCMPTVDQWEELYDNTITEWITQNGVEGRLLTSMNGSSLFLPAAGRCWVDGISNVGRHGYYWSSSLYINDPSYAWYFGFGSDNCGLYNFYLNRGFSVRPVRSSRQN